MTATTIEMIGDSVYASKFTKDLIEAGDEIQATGDNAEDEEFEDDNK